MEGENKCGKTFLFTRVTGKMIRPTEWEGSSIQMAKRIQANGKMTKLMEWAYICIRMDQNTLEIGSKMRNMALENSSGLMALPIKVNIEVE